MPNPLLPKVSIEALVKNIEATGATLGEKATALSRIIEEISTRLQNMQGKTPVTLGEDGVTLAFDRKPRSWAVWLVDSDTEWDHGEPCGEDLVGVSISRKARAFPLLLRLLTEIELEQQRQISEIETAFNAISAGSGKEGT